MREMKWTEFFQTEVRDFCQLKAPDNDIQLANLLLTNLEKWIVRADVFIYDSKSQETNGKTALLDMWDSLLRYWTWAGKTPKKFIQLEAVVQLHIAAIMERYEFDLVHLDKKNPDLVIAKRYRVNLVATQRYVLQKLRHTSQYDEATMDFCMRVVAVAFCRLPEFHYTVLEAAQSCPRSRLTQAHLRRTQSQDKLLSRFDKENIPEQPQTVEEKWHQVVPFGEGKGRKPWETLLLSQLRTLSRREADISRAASGQTVLWPRFDSMTNIPRQTLMSIKSSVTNSPNFITGRLNTGADSTNRVNPSPRAATPENPQAVSAEELSAVPEDTEDEKRQKEQEHAAEQKDKSASVGSSSSKDLNKVDSGGKARAEATEPAEAEFRFVHPNFFYDFVKYALLHVARISDSDVCWAALDGYWVLVQVFFDRMLDLPPIEYSQSFISCTEALLLNRDLLTFLVDIALRSTRLVEGLPLPVMHAFDLIDKWFNCYFIYISRDVRTLTSKEPFASLVSTPLNLSCFQVFMQALHICFDSNHHLLLARALNFIYAQVGRFYGEDRLQLVNELLLSPEMFTKLFTHWSWEVRLSYQHILLYKLWRGGSKEALDNPTATTTGGKEVHLIAPNGEDPGTPKQLSAQAMVVPPTPTAAQLNAPLVEREGGASGCCFPRRAKASTKAKAKVPVPIMEQPRQRTQTMIKREEAVADYKKRAKLMPEGFILIRSTMIPDEVRIDQMCVDTLSQRVKELEKRLADIKNKRKGKRALTVRAFEEQDVDLYGPLALQELEKLRKTFNHQQNVLIKKEMLHEGGGEVGAPILVPSPPRHGNLPKGIKLTEVKVEVRPD